MLNDLPTLIALVAMMIISFLVAFSAFKNLKRSNWARVVFVVFLSFGVLIGYGLHIQRDGFAVFARK